MADLSDELESLPNELIERRSTSSHARTLGEAARPRLSRESCHVIPPVDAPGRPSELPIAPDSEWL